MTEEAYKTQAQHCGFIFSRHRWGKWELVEHTELRKKLPWREYWSYAGELVIQRRQCQKCGYYQYDKRKIDI